MERDYRLEQDIILICKGWYNHDKYKSEFDALVAYYHKHYSGNFEPSRGFIVNLFFKPTVEYILMKKENYYSFINLGIFERNFLETLKDFDTDFYNVLYYRLLQWICPQEAKGVSNNGKKYELINRQMYDLKEGFEVI